MNTFKVGDKVLLRGNGLPLVVVSTSGCNGRELVAQVQDYKAVNYGHTYSRCLNGRFNDWMDGTEDIVPIPPEPLKWNEKWGAIFNYAAMDENGNWCCYVVKPDRRSYFWSTSNTGGAQICNDLKPTFTGDWRQSLIERPQP